VKGFGRYLRQTAIAGVFLLIPFLVLYVLFEKVYTRVHPVVHRAAVRLGWERILGSMTVSILSILALLLLCFAAGLLVRLPAFAAFRNWIENSLLRFLPGYDYVKMILAEKLGAEQDAKAEMVLAEIDGWQPAMLVERTPDGLCVVYVPGAPHAADGSIHVVAAESVRRLDAPMSAVLKSLRFYGRGMGEIVATAGGQSRREPPV
jgi:uncharacterized membrane protein